MGYLEGFLRHVHASCGKQQRGDVVTYVEYPKAASAPSRSASTAATSSTATRTAWRSASAASCAPASARPAASTCAAPTTRPDDPVSPGERYGFVYEINYLRCIHCDLCVEACPTEAITESKLFEFSFTNRARRHLHQGRAAGRRRRPAPAAPWEDWRAGRGRRTPRPGCGPPRPSRRRRLRGPGRPGPASSATACARPSRASADDRAGARAAEPADEPHDDARRPRRRHGGDH